VVGKPSCNDNAHVNGLVCDEPWSVEKQLIATFNLPLNLDQNHNHVFHEKLSNIRAQAKTRARSLPPFSRIRASVADRRRFPRRKAPSPSDRPAAPSAPKRPELHGGARRRARIESARARRGQRRAGEQPNHRHIAYATCWTRTASCGEGYPWTRARAAPGVVMARSSLSLTAHIPSRWVARYPVIDASPVTTMTESA